MNNYTRYWSFTWGTTVNRKKLPTKERLIIFFNNNAIEAVFQFERGSKKAKLHIQGCFELDSKRTSKREVLALFSGYFKNAEGLTLTPTYSSLDSKKYSQKQESRVEGPFYAGKKEFYDPEFVTKKMYPWQKDIYDLVTQEDTTHLRGRKVLLVENVSGGAGKSDLVKRLRVGQKKIVARKLPVASVHQLTSAVHLFFKQADVDLFMIDITRSKGKDQCFEDLFAAVEEVVNGYVVDVMFGRANESIFKPPMIVIFTNYNFSELFGYLSPDRWIPFQINNIDRELMEIHHTNGVFNYCTPYSKSLVKNNEAQVEQPEPEKTIKPKEII